MRDALTQYENCIHFRRKRRVWLLLGCSMITLQISKLPPSSSSTFPKRVCLNWFLRTASLQSLSLLLCSFTLQESDCEFSISPKANLQKSTSISVHLNLLDVRCLNHWWRRHTSWDPSFHPWLVRDLRVFPWPASLTTLVGITTSEMTDYSSWTWKWIITFKEA